MPKKEWTEEQRKAFGAKMKAAREKKLQEEVVKSETIVDEVPEPVAQEDTTPSEPSTADLLRMIEELKANQAKPAVQQAQIGPRGIVGTVEKYSVDPALYPSPIEALTKEARLAPFAFSFNYDMGWEVDIASYETKDGYNMKEPKFTLQLNRIVLDDDGEPTNKRWVVKRLIFFEDPQTALVMARDNGLEVNEEDEMQFLNEMRYLRMRDWLIDIFYPKPASTQKRKKQEVIGNTVVEVFEISSPDAQKIPFDQLKTPKM